MTSVAAVGSRSGAHVEPDVVAALAQHKTIIATLLVTTGRAPASKAPVTTMHVDNLWSKTSVLAVLRWYEATKARHLLWILRGTPTLAPEGLRRMTDCAVDTGVSMVFGDYYDRLADGTLRYHPLIDYQPGSIRDDFDMGAVVLLARPGLVALIHSIETETPDLQYAGFYDLRLRLSEQAQIYRLHEPVYHLPTPADRPTGQTIFDYVDPGNRQVQIEMERVATEHLKRTGAYVAAPRGMPRADDAPYPVQASVVIPVKNRRRTIVDAVHSALSQETSFDMNVIVVDNHSTDGTTEKLEELAKRDRRLRHLIPDRTDLGIGGCWNHAIYSEHCGRYAVQLDSDDLYDGTEVLQRLIAVFTTQPAALVIGAYTTVNFDLQPLPPGLVDHAEWTDANGHNNALRTAGLGAPRAYHVPTLRTIGFPNVSYGEDYAVVLKLCRLYRVGRIYESLYWYRRWEENTDSALSIEQKNRYDAYKDSLRTMEIMARRQLAEPHP